MGATQTTDCDQRTFWTATITDPKEFKQMTLRLSPEAIDEIERVEEASSMAAVRMGDLLVG